ncbi:MAG: class I SAM-dependent methyltransferase [Eubacterium sp.]
MQQNIYDNDIFFNEYIALRERKDNYNDLLEQPAMKKLLPDLKNKSVLDLGCGFAANCIDFVNRGAKRVIGIDLSKNMLNMAEQLNSSEKIKYLNMSMTEISKLNEKFDFVYSSLAFHYIMDFDALIKDIYSLLNDNGVLLFSQEHPIVTSSINGSNHFITDNGNIIGYLMSDYQNTGLRKGTWFVEGVEKYHRTFSQIINSLSYAGFKIEFIDEPVPDKNALKVRPGLAKEFIKPNFLMIKSKKIN